MGFFGGFLKKLGDPETQMRFAAAQAYLQDDPGAAMQAMSSIQKHRKDKEDSDASKEEKRVLGLAIDNDPGLAPRDKVYAKANPEAYIKSRMSRYDQVEMGPQGGSVGGRDAQGNMQWQQAPGRYQVDDALVQTGANGEQPKAIWESPYPKVVPGPDGSFNQVDRVGVAGLNSLNGQGSPQPGGYGGLPDPLAPRPSSGPVAVRSPQEIEALPDGAEYIAPDGRRFRKQTGGAGQRGPSMFPGAAY